MAVNSSKNYCDDCVDVMEQLFDTKVVTKTEVGSRVFYTDVVIIGNGPSGLALSAFLAGWRPFYDRKNPHPRRKLHDRFIENVAVSLIDQDFSWLEDDPDSNEGSLNRAFPALYDSMVRPGIDIGHDHPSSITWKPPTDSNFIPHVVLGRGAPGGAWNTFDADVHTLSLNRWMDLPGKSLADFLNSQKTEKHQFANTMGWNLDENSRLPCGIVAKYFRNYPRFVGIDPHQLPYSFVTSVSRNENQGPDDHLWSVIGYHSLVGQFHFRAKKLCLATGVTIPRRLGIPGEEQSAYIIHSAQKLEATTFSNSDFKFPVLVVGGGLTAADTVIKCLLRRLSVVHVFRKSQRETRKTVMGRLSESVYPEYRAITSLMSGKATDSTYLPYPNSKIVRFEQTARNTHSAVLEQSINGQPVEKRVEFGLAVINIGFEADLSFLGPELSEILLKSSRAAAFDPLTYRSNFIDHLYAVGPVAGDNYVRYLTGGCFAAARDMIKAIAKGDPTHRHF